jgi:Recombination endonuclease VII
MTKEERRRKQKNAASTKWREANKAKHIELSSAWHKAHPEKTKAAFAKWKVANPEKPRIASAAWYAKNSGKAIAAVIARQKENPEATRAYNRAWHRRNRERQAPRPRPSMCELCGRGGRICFDHCHQSGQFRGWLCGKCNTTLGLVDDNPLVLVALTKYLKTHHKRNGTMPRKGSQ